MRTRFVAISAMAALAFVSGVARTVAQGPNAFLESRDHPAIQYSDMPGDNRVTRLAQRLRDGSLTFSYDPVRGYLSGLLDGLGLSTASQVLVFSETSFQAPRINVANPRAVFFDDTVYVGWVRGGDILEVAVHDPQQGIQLFEVRQDPMVSPTPTRNEACLACHLSWDTLAVPGLLMHSTAPLATERSYATGFPTDHRSPLIQRWGGWFVTGSEAGGVHMGNVPLTPADRATFVRDDPQSPLMTVDGLFDLAGYPSHESDVVALMILAHQTGMANRITRLGWEARVTTASGSDGDGRIAAAASDLVDYLLFVDEAPLPGRISGGTTFSGYFESKGPRDATGRSLRDLDLDRRLLRYPCSYLIYSDAFDALPAVALDAVYQRLWAVLSGAVDDTIYDRLSLEDRTAIVEILLDTKETLPEYFRSLAI